MQAYDFETLKSRADIGSSKWSRMTDAEKAQGIVPMSVADMELSCAPEILAAVTEAARFGLYGYTTADDRYLRAVAGWMHARHGFAVKPEWIVPVSGVVPAMCVAVQAYCAPGDKVLVHTPGYPPFTAAIEKNGCTPVYSELLLDADGRYRIDFDDMEQKAQDPAVTLLFLCSPHNPTGRIWTLEELIRVADICQRNNVLLVSDEIHFDLELHGKHLVISQAAPQIRDACVILTAPSKTFNLAGLQNANVIIENAALRHAFAGALEAGGGGGVSYFGYHASIAAYTACGPWLDALLDFVRGNFGVLEDWLASNLPQVKCIPVEGTYLAWTDWRALGLKAEALEKFVRKEAGLILNEGSMFGTGGAGFMRWNLALPRAALQRALDSLGAAAKRAGYLQ